MGQDLEIVALSRVYICQNVAKSSGNFNGRMIYDIKYKVMHYDVVNLATSSGNQSLKPRSSETHGIGSFQSCSSHFQPQNSFPWASEYLEPNWMTGQPTTTYPWELLLSPTRAWPSKASWGVIASTGVIFPFLQNEQVIPSGKLT